MHLLEIEENHQAANPALFFPMQTCTQARKISNSTEAQQSLNQEHKPGCQSLGSAANKQRVTRRSCTLWWATTQLYKEDQLAAGIFSRRERHGDLDLILPSCQSTSAGLVYNEHPAN